MRRKREREEMLNALAEMAAQRDDAREAALALRNELTLLQRQRQYDLDALADAQGYLAAIRGSMADVAVYEGLPIGNDNLLLYVNDLVRDHEELERRIDLAIMECASGSEAVLAHIADILKGAVPTPDSPVDPGE